MWSNVDPVIGDLRAWYELNPRALGCAAIRAELRISPSSLSPQA